MTPYYAELSSPGIQTVRFDGTQSLECLGIGSNGIEGWDSTPAAKAQATERGQGDGGYDIATSDILYAARTVTVHYSCVGLTRESIVRQTDAIRSMVHRPVRLRVVDVHDTYCDGGYVSVTQNAKWHEGYIDDSTLTIVFERPERLSTQATGCQLIAREAESGMGLYYGQHSNGLVFPLDFGETVPGLPNTGLLTNAGTSRAYPIYRVTGPFPHGVRIDFPNLGQSLTVTQPVGDVPLILDTRTRTATIGGLDVSRTITRRQWPTIPPASSLRVTLRTVGSGWVDVETHDTYI